MTKQIIYFPQFYLVFNILRQKMNAHRQYYGGLSVYNKRLNTDITMKPISLRDKIEKELMETFMKNQAESDKKRYVIQKLKKRNIDITQALAQGETDIKEITGKDTHQMKLSKFRKAARELGIKTPSYYVVGGNKRKSIDNIGNTNRILIPYKGDTYQLGKEPLNKLIRERQLDVIQHTKADIRGVKKVIKNLAKDRDFLDRRLFSIK